MLYYTPPVLASYLNLLWTISAGNIIAIVISVVSSIAVLVAGVLIGIYILNNRYVKMKRKGIFKTAPFYLLKISSLFLLDVHLIAICIERFK